MKSTLEVALVLLLSVWPGKRVSITLTSDTCFSSFCVQQIGLESTDSTSAGLGGRGIAVGAGADTADVRPALG